MKTHTHKISQDIPELTGEAHVQKLSLPKNLQEITLDSVWPRIVVLLGNSRKKVWIIITPGGDPAISDADINRMELAIREPFLHMDTLFGHKWTIPAFRATREKVSETIGVRHTLEMLDAERRLDLLFEVHGIHLFRNPELRTAAGKLGETVTSENKKSVHIWDEITHKLLRTPEGRKLFRQLRPLYLEKQRKKEEAELQEFRSVDVLFQRLLAEIRPTNLFIGSPEKGGRFEIYARHISKIAWDSNPKLSKPVQDISDSSVTLNLKSYTPIESNFEV
jgi:hypothetical protein